MMKMNGVWLTLAFLGCGTLPALAATADRPNIVFILADDLGWRDVGCFGSTYHQTPNIDALAKRGMLFTQAYAANPLCSPTRASLMTGQYPARIGMTAPVGHQPEVKLQASVKPRGAPNQKSLVADSVTRLATNYLTLAETLKTAGYATGHFGKWHLGSEPYSPLQQGFDLDVPHWPGPGPAGSYVAPWKFPPKLQFVGRPGEHIEDRMASEAVKFIAAHREHPFFLNYWAFSVHAPYDAKPSLVEKHRESMDENLPQHNPLYAAMVHSLDDAVGTIAQALAANGLMDKTIIVFFSDNGGVNWQALKKEGPSEPSERSKPYDNIPPTSNAPLRGGKASIYEGGTREPCFIVWPGVVKSDTASDALIQSIDFYPTLAEIAGAKLPSGQAMDGRSFLPVLRGETNAHRDTIFDFFPHYVLASGQSPAASVRQGDWKLIRYFHDGPHQEHRYELYNLREDLGETNNLADAQPVHVKELDALLEQFLKDSKALVPGANPAYKASNKTSPPADPLQGWQPRNCEANVKDGVLTLTATSDAGFLGVAAGKFAGVTTIKIRVRSAHGGTGKVQWLPASSVPEPAKAVPFQMSGGDWQELVVELPASGSLGVVRLYLPADNQPVQLDWVEMKSAGGKSQRWEF